MPAGELASGWILGEPRVGGRSALVQAPLGKGRVVLIGLRSRFRAQPHGTFKVLFNVVLSKRGGGEVESALFRRIGEWRIMECMDGLLKEKRGDILRIAAKHGAHNVRVFGSFARGEARADSDVDFLVDFERGRGMFDIGGMLLDLEALLGRKVDLAEPGGLHWYIKDRVLKEAVPL